ncbi:LytR family transcriptional regulator [Heyndrickxia sporothermodurans]|uniref:polyisoprenyl-teichoic acid--peptidoglycan teichoic acid transferase TagU n=1 Tax=Heyndrickxia sporothermodurans TaxID=46224 RepID=UPI002E21BB3B|nr:LytR family transcriptional regulator [Heyndrickxia sporothermodurans]MED3653223.1 LytR family transcriptional regulator [Heyndrickxia sporothermodurans]MED3697195.1 LytR family transcriptional regulator [Heyndrickxia sporothermodurans]MED3781119.1 LytR family transcriptional regulator [Heyndrickxia sporothermodurans]
MRSNNLKKKKMKKRKIIGIILLVLILGTSAYVYSIYHSLTKAVNTMHNPVDRKSSREKEIRFKDKDPISILMLGVDERKGDRGRSDTMIVLTVNPTVKSVQMLSIPRDTRVEIVGKGTEDKINHAYAFGGVAMSMNTVEKFLDIPVDYYIKVNMEGFEDIVNAVGGVTVNNTLDFSYGGYHFPKGEVNLDGKKALAFVRMRKEDPRGDFGRNDRQRQVIQGVISKGASVSALTKYNDVFETLGKNVETNLTFDEMMSIQKYYKDARHKIEQFQLKGQGTKIGGIYYYIVPQDEKQKAHNRLKQHLEL